MMPIPSAHFQLQQGSQELPLEFQKASAVLAPNALAGNLPASNAPPLPQQLSHYPSSQPTRADLQQFPMTPQPLLRTGSCPGQICASPNSSHSHSVPRPHSPHNPSGQHYFALHAGRAPSQYFVPNPVQVLPTSSESLNNDDVQVLQILGLSSTDDIAAVLHKPVEPFCGVADRGDMRIAHAKFSGPAFNAPRMEREVSNSTSGYYTAEELEAISPHSATWPLNRHSRTFSQGSYGSYLSNSPTDVNAPMVGPNMSRQASASGTSLLGDNVAMLRMGSAQGYECESGNGNLEQLPGGVKEYTCDDSPKSSNIVADENDNVTTPERNSSRNIAHHTTDGIPRSVPASPTTHDDSEDHRDQSSPPTDQKKVSHATRSSRKPRTSKGPYVRPAPRRVLCQQCNSHPDGFRGDHELRRHTLRAHKKTRTMYVIKDISKGKKFLEGCKSCQSGKKYGIDYNAAAHLRRQHFTPGKTKGKGGDKMRGDVAAHDSTLPDMKYLRRWIQSVEVTEENEEKDGKSSGRTEFEKAGNKNAAEDTERITLQGSDSRLDAETGRRDKAEEGVLEIMNSIEYDTSSSNTPASTSPAIASSSLPGRSAISYAMESPPTDPFALLNFPQPNTHTIANYDLYTAGCSSFQPMGDHCQIIDGGTDGYLSSAFQPQDIYGTEMGMGMNFFGEEMTLPHNTLRFNDGVVPLGMEGMETGVGRKVI